MSRLFYGELVFEKKKMFDGWFVWVETLLLFEQKGIK